MDLNINTIKVIDQLNKKNFLPGLYIVSTPIGNLADISIRALSLLSLSKLILCEDTRNSKKLIMKYGIKATLKAFHKFNSTKEIPNILNKLREGSIISIISDAGTPLISDPGESIVQKCIDEKIPIFSVPGASSVLGGIVLSGMDISKFTFLGFMPQIKKLKEQFLERIIFSQEALIIYESPKRIKSSLNYFYKHIPNRKIAIIRELTKKNEEVIRGTVETVNDEFLKRVDVKGELTLIIDGDDIIKKNQFTNDEILSIINLYKKTMTHKEIVLKVSSKFNVAKRKVYQLIIDNK
jgi:16S rRNA (cytidine1402-2'-O)-methyltransferase